jgi:hypothetical protein
MNQASSSETSTRAVLSLVFGVLALSGACPCIGGILAILLGAGEPSGVARAGVILGWVHFALTALILIVVASVFGVALLAGAVD